MTNTELTIVDIIEARKDALAIVMKARGATIGIRVLHDKLCRIDDYLQNEAQKEIQDTFAEVA